ncbi:ABC transporter substrate-binding protein [Antarctobacter sp.]|uniref:ABC transporter substrate-binding protein n=1 Tax=Antarctobacter sp. TaxID=1872577 RepID=UPI002B27A3DD|nr:ABC transporter substrate-binding protein [Antarctobacter sp.]
MITRRNLNKSLLGASALALGTLPSIGMAQDRPAIRIAVDNLWRTMSPLNGLSTTGNRININFYEALTEVDWLNDPTGATVIPKLATSWERDGVVWRITLREGVMFHHGVEMTAEDVAFTLSHERLRADDAYESRGAIFSSNMVRVDAVERYVVEIETDSPDPNMPQKLSNHHAKVVPKDHYLEVGVDAFGQMPIGTGPYKVTLFRPGEVMTIDAFEDYWGSQPGAADLLP